MANIDKAFDVRFLSIDDSILLASSTIDPIGVGFEAPIGSLYVWRPSGQLYTKFGALDVEWRVIQSYPNGINSISNSSTGLITGGELTINTDTTKFDVGAGTGIIIDHETDPLDPSAIIISWPAFTGVTASFLGVSDASSVAINAAGAIFQKSSGLTNIEHKQYIAIGIMGHGIPSVNILAVRNNPDPVHGPAERLADFSRAMGPINVEGNIFTPSGTNLQLKKSSGRTHLVGINFHNELEDVDVSTDIPLNPTSFRYSRQDGTGDFTLDAPTTLIIPGKWDNGSGTLQNVPGGQWTIQVCWFFAGVDEVRIEYGQRLFSTKEAALDLLPDPDHISNPTFRVGNVRAFVVIGSGATDLSNLSEAIVVEGAKFGSSAGGQFSSSITDLQQAYNNSLDPEILTETSRGALTLRDGVGSGNLYEGLNQAGTLIYKVGVNGSPLFGELTYPHIDGTNGQVLVTDGAGTISFASISGTSDELVKVSSADTTAGYLNTKLLDGTGIDLTINNVGGNETLTISIASGISTVVQTSHATIPQITGTSTIPIDSTVPLITEGAPLWSHTITPPNVLNNMEITTSLAFAVSKASASFSVAIFRGNVCVGAMSDTASNNNSYQTVSFTIHDDPGVTTAITYTARVGTSVSATWWVNTDNSGNDLGGMLESNSWIINETAVVI